jgi:hypothetical protein
MTKAKKLAGRMALGQSSASLSIRQGFLVKQLSDQPQKMK